MGVRLILVIARFNRLRKKAHLLRWLTPAVLRRTHP